MKVALRYTLFYISTLIFSNIYSQTIAAGDTHSYAITNNGTVVSWGGNGYGQLGDSTTTYKKLPVQVKKLTNVIAISKGSAWASYFLKSDSTVWACGSNAYGQLGNSTISQTATTTVPVPVLGLTGITAIASGEHHALFLKRDGTVWTCGYNGFGQLGDGTIVNRNIPVQVSGLSGIIAVEGGWQHSLFLKNDGTAWACGYNNYGQLGDGTTINRNIPVQISGLSEIKSISAGVYHSLFLKNDSTVMACGYNGFGQLGDGTTTDKLTPTQIPNLNDVNIIVGGGGHSLFLKNNGTVWTCGINNYGQLGDGTTINRNTPTQIVSLTGIVAVTGWIYHSLFIKNDCTTWACGWNAEGQLGDNTLINRSTPVKTKNICIVPIPTSVNEPIGIENHIRCYPNPTTGKLILENENLEFIEARVYSVIGKLVFQTTITNQQTILDLSAEPNGVYFVQLQTKNGIINKKIIKES